MLNKRLPDAINCSTSRNYTSIPNEVLRNPLISAKAKTILFILLSNREGWVSYKKTLGQMMKEGVDAIEAGIKELEKNGHLLRIRYKDKKTKQWKGSFWAYGDIPWQFDVTEQYKELDKQGLDPHHENPHVGNPHPENPGLGNPTLIILNRKKTNRKKINLCLEEEGTNGKFEFKRITKISPKVFNTFWNMYPRKGSKGASKTAWDKLCNKKERPSWLIIKSAIKNQIESEQWQTPKYIPLASTWLNQSKWLDDPTQMISYDDKQQNNSNTTGSRNNTSNELDYSKLQETEYDPTKQ